MLDTVFLKAVVATGAKSLTESLISALKKQEIFRKGVTDESFKNAISDHFEVTFEKCATIKTIMRDKREPFDTIYSPQSFFLRSERIDQNQLANHIRDNGDSIIIQGSGGSGKSMFFRFLWLSYFARYQDKVPVLIELRNMNSLTHDKIEDYIYYTIVSRTRDVPQSYIHNLIKIGKLILFLDGFDEINHNIRDKIQRQINELKHKNRNLQIIVTSRDDERFFGWHKFETVRVAPLNMDECIGVIEKAPFDSGDKEKLGPIYVRDPCQRVTHVYRSQFYELSFDALYYRHDLSKDGGYVRKFYTSYNKHKFQRILSFFCLRTYYDEAFEFSAERLNNYIFEAKNIEKKEFGDMNNNDFIKDILESVCLLKKEGIEFGFTHRKLQEYFAAHCIARVASRNLESLFRRFSYRYSDDVLGLVYDLNPDLFREKYIFPIYRKYKQFFRLKRKSAIVRKYAEMTSSAFNADFLNSSGRKNSKGKNKRVALIHYTGSGEIYHFYQNTRRVWPHYYPNMRQTGREHQLDYFFFGSLRSRFTET